MQRGIVWQLGDGFRQPRGVDNAQIVALQNQRLLGEKLGERFGFFAVFRLPFPWGVVEAVFLGTAFKKPA